MKKGIIAIFIVVIIAIIAAVMNPKAEQHQQALKSAIRKGLSVSLKQNGVKDNAFFEEMTVTLFDNVLWSGIIEEGVGRKNYIVFSTSQFNYLGKNYTAGIGAFGKVWVFKEVEKQTTAKLNKLIKDGGGLKKSLGY